MIFIISIPFCLIITLIIHELSHLILFKLFGMKVTEIKIGILKMDFHNEKRIIKICGKNFFSGYCSIIYPSDCKKKKLAVIAFAGGGISGIIESLLSFYILMKISVSDNIKKFLLCLIFTGLYSFYTTLLRKSSADNQAIKKLFIR